MDEEHEEPPERVIGFVSDAGVIGHILEEVRAIRSEQREDHRNVMAKIEDLSSEMRQLHTAAAAANALGQSNALEIEVIKDKLREQDSVFLTAGGLARFVSKMLGLLGEHDDAARIEQGIQKERRRWLTVPRLFLNEAPKLLLIAGATIILGAGVAIGAALEFLK